MTTRAEIAEDVKRVRGFARHMCGGPLIEAEQAAADAMFRLCDAAVLGTCPKHREGRIHWDETVNEYRCAECGFPLIGPPPVHGEPTRG